MVIYCIVTCTAAHLDVELHDIHGSVAELLVGHDKEAAVLAVGSKTVVGRVNNVSPEAAR